MAVVRPCINMLGSIQGMRKCPNGRDPYYSWQFN